MKAYEVKNAIIEKATIEIEEHMLLTFWLSLNYGGSGQGFGGHALYLPKSFKNHDIETPAGHFIYRILEIAGAKKWSDLAGKTIRVRANWTDIVAIGHIVNDDWFCPDEDFPKKPKDESKENASPEEDADEFENDPIMPDGTDIRDFGDQ